MSRDPMLLLDVESEIEKPKHILRLLSPIFSSLCVPPVAGRQPKVIATHAVWTHPTV